MPATFPPAGSTRRSLPVWLRRKAAEFLASGLGPGKLALTLALGVTLGILPLLWGTTLLCVVAAFLFRLNQGAMQIINYLAYPLQFALLIPYYRLGGFLFPGDAGPSLPPAASFSLLADAGTATLKAVGAWGLTAPAVALVVYAVSLTLLRSALRRREDRERSATG